MIDVTDLSKSYGPIEALRGVTFHIAPGEIVGLLGPNGAGTTTTIKILTGYLQPVDGTVHVNGLDVLTHTREVQADMVALGTVGRAGLGHLLRGSVAERILHRAKVPVLTVRACPAARPGRHAGDLRHSTPA